MTLALAACGGGGDDSEPVVAERADSDSAAALSAGTAGAADARVANASAAGPIFLASATAGGAAGNAGGTTCAVSADGRKVLFSSDASNLVPGDTNRTSDLFLKHLDTGAIQRVTTLGNGGQLAAGGNCLGTTMTPDGRVVAFNSGLAVFAKNTQTGELIQASPPAGTVPQVDGYFGGVVSDDGSKLVFMTQPRQVYLGGYDFANEIPARLMVRDLATGSLVTLATDNGIVQQGQIASNRFAISPDGTRVAFISTARLAPADASHQPDVFVRDLVSGETLLASSNANGTQVTPAASGSVFYTRPAFVSNTLLSFGTGQATSLGEGGLYLKDLASGSTSLVLNNAQGGGAAQLSGDASRVVFTRVYSGWNARVFLRNRATGVETLVSSSATGVASNNNATGPLISRDGTRVVFGSNASNLVSSRLPSGVFQIYAKTPSAAAATR